MPYIILHYIIYNTKGQIVLGFTFRVGDNHKDDGSQLVPSKRNRTGDTKYNYSLYYVPR